MCIRDSYMLINVINGFWVVSVFVYGKDISMVHQPAFVATFVQAVNAVGVVLGRIAELLVRNKTGDSKMMVAKILIGVSLGGCCLYQLISFFTYIKDEPIKYIYEKHGEESACELLNEMITDKESIEVMMHELQKDSLYKKFKGVNFLSIFSRYYRRAFIVCLGLFLFKVVHHILSFSNRIPIEFKDSTRVLSLVNSIVKVILVFGALFFIDKISRKRILLIGYGLYVVGNVLCSITMSLYIAKVAGVMSYLFLGSVMFTDWAYYALLTYMPYVFVLELLPDKGVAFLLAVYSVCSALSSFSMGFIIRAGEIKWLYYPLMVIVSIGAIVFIECLVKETKDVSEQGTKRAYLVEDDGGADYDNDNTGR
eukprot:TRINITY_DN691_c0_g1_i10.p1 TRINITY_DN691_c0_g1~~TRINITY_DN691_c0_g1_i10.p1  ORF type:complete len:367 (+),score=109.16 TRINITY_DN691_c0_g1_i10:75-1175(+)